MKIKKFLLVLISITLSVLTFLGVVACDKSDEVSVINASASVSETKVKKRTDFLSDDVFSVSSSNIPVVKNEYLAKRFTVKLNNTSAYYTSNYGSDERGYFYFSMVNTNDDKEKMRVVLAVDSSTVRYSYYDYSETGFYLSFSNRNRPLFTVTDTSNINNHTEVIEGGYIPNNGQLLPFVNNEFYIDFYGAVDSNTNYRLDFYYQIVRTSDKTFKYYEAWYDIVATEVNQFYFVSNMGSVDKYIEEVKPTTGYYKGDIVDEDKCICSENVLVANGSSLSTLAKNAYEGIYQLDAPNAYFGHLSELAYNIAYSIQSIVTELRYLENIEGTPFARMVSKTVVLEYTADSPELSFDTINLGLTKAGYEECPKVACQSAIKNFKKVSDNIYQADYYSSVCVKQRNSDGKTNLMTLDCNKSFFDYFEPFSGVYGAEIYNNFCYIVLNDILVRQYPDAFKDYEFNQGNNLYGLWGFSVIPQNSFESLTDAFVYSLDDTEVREDITFYAYDYDITNDQYTALLAEYDYMKPMASILGWTDYFTDTKNCTFVLFFTDGSVDGTVVSQNGSSDMNNNNSETENQIHETLEDAKDKLDKFVADFKNLLGEDYNLFKTMVSASFCVLGLVGFVIILSWLYKKLGGKKNG